MGHEILEDADIIKEGLQPYLVQKLEVDARQLDKIFLTVIPKDELVVRKNTLLSQEEIRAIESMGLKRLEV